MSKLKANLDDIRHRIANAALAAGRDPNEIRLVAVSKYVPVSSVSELLDYGHLDFGENRVQDGISKIETVAREEVRWHLIGRIQTNKIKYLPAFHLIHGLDRWDLAEKMSNYALAQGTVFPCLVQVNVADDASKAGIQLSEVNQFIAKVRALRGLNVQGLMTITALDAEKEQTMAWFELLAKKYNCLKESDLPSNVQMKWLSMGMSDDFEMAIAAGANMVRVGSAIFAREGE